MTQSQLTGEHNHPFLPVWTQTLCLFVCLLSWDEPLRYHNDVQSLILIFKELTRSLLSQSIVIRF